MELDDLVNSINKKFGDGAILRMDQEPDKIEVISTGSLEIDKALVVGGYPKGRIIEIYGPEASGKTTLALHGIAEAQKLGLTAAFVDAEHSLDLSYAQKIGVNLDRLLVSQPDCGEDALDIVDELIRSKEIAIVVVDSVAALVPKAELEGEMGQAHMGLQARLMSQCMRKITGIVSKTKSIVIFINQIRSKIGIVFGNPNTTTGGNALKFYSSIRIEIKPKDKITKGTDIIGNNIVAKIVKNRVAPPFREAATSIVFGKGIDKTRELLSYFLNEGTIEKAGAWYKYKDNKIQGEDKMLSFIEEHIEEFSIGG